MLYEVDYILRKMPELLRRLRCGPLLSQDHLQGIPRKGVYVFLDHSRCLYVGRSNDLKKRIKNHSEGNASKAALAFILTRDKWGLWNNPLWERDLYKKIEDKESVEIRNCKGQSTTAKLSMKVMLKDEFIKQDFECQGKRVKKMQVRVNRRKDQYEQAMFEKYAAYVLNTRYNTFKTT